MAAVTGRLASRIKEAREGTSEPPFVRTSFVDLNRLLGGLRVGLWTVIAARPKQGKTSWWEQEAVWQASRGHGVIACSMEMSPDEHTERMAIRESRCRLSSRELYTTPTAQNLEQHASFNEALSKITQLPIHWVKSQRRRKLDEVLSDLTLAMQACETTPKLAIVDYMQLIHPRGKHNRADLGHAEVSTALCEWLSGTGMAGILVAHLNRAIEKENRAPRLSDIREAGQLEQDAGAVCFLHRESKSDADDDDQAEQCDIIVAAARFGKKGKVPLWWRGPELRFESRDQDHGRASAWW